MITDWDIQVYLGEHSVVDVVGDMSLDLRYSGCRGGRFPASVYKSHSQFHIFNALMIDTFSRGTSTKNLSS